MKKRDIQWYLKAFERLPSTDAKRETEKVLRRQKRFVDALVVLAKQPSKAQREQVARFARELQGVAEKRSAFSKRFLSFPHKIKQFLDEQQQVLYRTKRAHARLIIKASQRLLEASSHLSKIAESECSSARSLPEKRWKALKKRVERHLCGCRSRKDLLRALSDLAVAAEKASAGRATIATYMLRYLSAMHTYATFIEKLEKSARRQAAKQRVYKSKNNLWSMYG